MNPSSYLYVDGRRRRRRAARRGAAPRCLRYDDYKYGLRDLNSYMRPRCLGRNSPTFVHADTWYLAGDAETAPTATQISAARPGLQGANGWRGTPNSAIRWSFESVEQVTSSSTSAHGHSDVRCWRAKLPANSLFTDATWP